MVEFLFNLFPSMGGIIIVAVVFLYSAVKITREYERGVIFRLGRLVGTRGPGLFLLIPGIEKMVKIDLRIITLDVPAQEVITRDNIPITVDAVLYFKVSDPVRSVVEVEDFMKATSQIAQTSLRGVAGEAAFDEILAERDKINSKLHKIIDKATDPWGIKVSAVEIKHVEVPEAMQRAIAKQAEAERVRRAKIILAEGEFQAAHKLKAAGKILGANPIVFRYLETMAEAAREKSTTIIFPAEMLDMVKKISRGLDSR
ncbi:slipin family protein [Patescibacteria group bacterium]|nr:slipin family protein [Patescibacteria group bacterium]